jgi:hypothetical protein
MLLDGNTANSVSENLGFGSPSLPYRWKAELKELRNKLRRAEGERNNHKKHFKSARVSDLYQMISVLAQDSFLATEVSRSA